MTRTDPVPSKVGFVGVGHLASLLAHSLLSYGCEVAVTDLRKENAASLLTAGASWRESPRAAAEGTYCLITCRPTPQTVSRCLEGDSGALAGMPAGGTWIDMSTNDLGEVQRIARRAADEGVDTPRAHRARLRAGSRPGAGGRRGGGPVGAGREPGRPLGQRAATSPCGSRTNFSATPRSNFA